ncbi:hypothetical protein BGZ89_004425, partial [Linnemannia elongata]
DTERKQIREQAARINQEMRATTRYVPPLFRGLLKQQQQPQSATSSPRLSATDGSFLEPPGSGSPRPNSLGRRFRNIPSSLSMAPLSAAAQKRFGVIRQNSSRLGGDQQQQGPLSAPPITPSSRHRLSESFLPAPASPSSPVTATTTQEVSGTGSHRSSEETSIHDILAETNVSYDKGQHAVYEDPLPGHEHRGYRHFNTLQYNYDAHRSNNSKSSSSTTAATAAAAAATNARRKKILMRQRRRRSGGTVGSVGTGAGFNQDDDDEDLDLDLELELDFEHLENNHHRVTAAKSSPESPQWHLTSVELAKMEAENLKRNSLASGGGSDGLGLMPGGDGVGRGVDDIRSTGSGGSGTSARTAHTTSAPTHFNFATTTTTSSSAPASTSPTPKTLTPTTGGPSGNLIRPPIGGTRFSRFSPGVPAVSFSNVMMTSTTRPDQEEFPWQQQASTPVTNPVIIYSPPPPEPGDDDYQSPEHEQVNAHPRNDDVVAVVPPTPAVSGENETTTAARAEAETKAEAEYEAPLLERFQSLSPAIMHLPPPAIESFDSHGSSETVVASELSTLPPGIMNPPRPQTLGIRAPSQTFSPRSQGQQQ